MRHSSYGALIRGYRVTVPRDAVCAFEGVDAEDALDYLVMAYGADRDGRRDPHGATRWAPEPAMCRNPRRCGSSILSDYRIL